MMPIRTTFPGILLLAIACSGGAWALYRGEQPVRSGAGVQLAQVFADGMGEGDQPIGGPMAYGAPVGNGPIGGPMVYGDPVGNGPIGGPMIYGDPVGNAPIGGPMLYGAPVDSGSEGEPIGGDGDTLY